MPTKPICRMLKIKRKERKINDVLLPPEIIKMENIILINMMLLTL